jgi:NADPH:quinone reductase-like Zn-dependent oxidoreductase
MRAVVQDAYGSTDVLELREIARPPIGPGEALVRVHAAGVDRGVWHLMTGLPYLVRLAGYGLRTPRRPVLGYDVAGVVEAIGEDVTDLTAGDEVFGTCHGSFAEYASARADRLASKPANLSFQQAAAVPISGCTALQAVRDRGRIQPDQSVLVIGASGGVGTFAVQIAKAYGAEVTGVCSTAKIDLVRALGADDVIDYTREDFASRNQRWDVILDIGGNRSLAHLRRALAPDGTLVIVGGEGGGRWLGGVDRQLRAHALSPFVKQRLGTWISTARREDLDELRELIESGTIIPVVDRTFQLADAHEAIEYLREGRAQGKVVIGVVREKERERVAGIEPA